MIRFQRSPGTEILQISTATNSVGISDIFHVEIGDKIEIVNSPSNDGVYTVISITPGVNILLLDLHEALTASSLVGEVLVPGYHYLEMRNPIVGDGDSVDLNSIRRASRGGTLINHRDSNWHKVRRFQISFEILRNIDQIINFFSITAGLEIVYTDYTGVTWQGYILDPVIEEAIQRQCAYTCSLIFQVKETEECYILTEASEYLQTEDEEYLIQEECDE